MSWLEHIGQPLRPTREEAEAFITAELTRTVPPGWRVERCADPGYPPGAVRYLAWRIIRTEFPPGESPRLLEYAVLLSASLEYLIFTYGNTDVGPLALHHALQRALVIEACMLREFGMAECIDHLVSHCEPNECGLT